MKNSIKIFLLLLVCQLSLAQKLVYQNRGNIQNDKSNNLTSAEIRTLLINNETLLAEYNAGRTKKTVGNVLLVGGLSLSSVALASPLFEDKPVSIELVAVGFVSVLVAIPVKIGFTKKIKHVVSEYNNLNTIGVKNFEVNKLDVIANSNGLGLKLTLN